MSIKFIQTNAKIKFYCNHMKKIVNAYKYKYKLKKLFKMQTKKISQVQEAAEYVLNIIKLCGFVFFLLYFLNNFSTVWTFILKKCI